MERNRIEERYRQIIIENEGHVRKLKKRLFGISMIRLAVFLMGAAGAVATFTYSALYGIIIMIVSFSVFLLLLRHYAGLSDKIAFRKNLIRINNLSLLALKGDFSAFDNGADRKNRNHDFADDIDLFGEDSLFGYLNRTVTGYGRDILSGWLSDPYSFRHEITHRQQAVTELAPMLEWRQEFMAYGLDRKLEKEEISSIARWLEARDEMTSSLLFRVMLYLLPAVAIALLAFSVAGLISVYFFVAAFLLNLGLTSLFLKKSNSIHSLVSGKYYFLSSLGNLISTAGKVRFSSGLMAGISSDLSASGISAVTEIRKLSRIIQAYDSRLNLFAGLLLNGLIMWDFQCLCRLEKWKKGSAVHLPGWLEAIGKIDSLLSLADHSYNNPGFIFPAIANDHTVLRAVKMGHPLIEENKRICNDFSISHKGLICIITGANMAGKSTFLRSIAVNMILGMAGTTVCAAEFVFTPCRLFTSMRTTDSLSKNESYFYAELKRLKILKERIDSGDNTFFILDEILKGTNSEDKSTGSRLYLSKLADSYGTGLIATHDISLGEMENKYPDNIFNKCFEVRIDGESVMFDYLLRDGITRHMNAGILMKQMGII